MLAAAAARTPLRGSLDRVEIPGIAVGSPSGMSAEDASRIEVLEAEERRLRVMLESVPDFIARITLDGKFLDLNHVAPGLDKAKVVGSSFEAYIPEAFHGRARAAVKTAYETRSVQQFATIGPLSADVMGHFLTRVNPVVENGEVTSFVMTATNVTALEEHRLLLQHALEAMGLGTFSFNPATGAGAWDDVAGRMFGFANGESMPGLARFFTEWVHPEDLDGVKKAFERTFVTQQFGPMEYRIRLPNGSTRWVSATGTTMRDPHGKVTTIVGTVKDVTDRRALEARLRDAEKLESIGRLAGGVAHDFNNMLTAILGNVAFAATMDSIEEARPLLEEVRLAAERSAALTAQLLAFARRQIIEPKVLAPDASIERLEPLLRRLLDERKRLELSLGASGHVRIGESQLEQVVMNLVTNARDAVPGGGRITVATHDALLEGADCAEMGLIAGPYVMISVTDTGRGIPQHVLPHLFEPFFTTREGGTGLGLATCYGIVKQHSGAISVESELGRGSTFRVYLPRVEAPAAHGDASSAAVRRGAPIKVLIVEDEENVRRVLNRALRGGEFAAFVASGAEEARRIADQHGPFDVLVTDIVMPDVDGPELARELRARYPELRVLFVSGYSQELPFQDQPHDVTAFLQKPFQPSELADAVHKLWGASRSRRGR
jgi:two-component system cell cycle sensor histidine kinase/response regulator CckA